MANAPDDVRKEKIADALRPFLAEGEELVIRNRQGQISATPTATLKLREEHPRLYGQLLSANEKLQSGCGGPLLGMVIAGILCLGLTLRWWDDLLGEEAADALRQAWWFSIFLFIIAIGMAAYLSEIRHKLTYRGLRSDLIATMDADNFDRDLLVSLIQGDPDLSQIGRQLKLDRGLSAQRPGAAV